MIGFGNGTFSCSQGGVLNSKPLLLGQAILKTSLVKCMSSHVGLLFGHENPDVFHRRLVLKLCDGKQSASQFAFVWDYLYFQKGCVFHHCQDVMQHDWISALEATPTDFAFASPPCQCWSSAGWATGLLHKFGPVVLHSVMKLAYIRPRVIGLENVQGLRRHDHWPALLALFEYVGFDLIGENEVNLLDVLPQKRTRYLAILRDRYRRGAARPQFADWFVNAPVSLGQADVVLPSAIARTLGSDISLEVLSKYQDPRFMRGGNVMSRIKQFRDVFGCIMASYRFLTHVEMILLQGGAGTFHLTGNDREISRIIGNCIAVPHAALVIANALTCAERGMQIAVHPEEAVQAVLGLRL